MHNALVQMREALLAEVVSLTPTGQRETIKSDWKQEYEQVSGKTTERRITVDEHDKETLEIIEGMS